MNKAYLLVNYNKAFNNITRQQKQLLRKIQSIYINKNILILSLKINFVYAKSYININISQNDFHWWRGKNERQTETKYFPTLI